MILAGALALGGCATAVGGDQTGPYAGRHDHMRDAKQGPALSPVQPAAAPAPKVLHDHREMK